MTTDVDGGQSGLMWAKPAHQVQPESETRGDSGEHHRSPRGVAGDDEGRRKTSGPRDRDAVTVAPLEASTPRSAIADL